jgi:hypothetical protein
MSEPGRGMLESSMIYAASESTWEGDVVEGMLEGDVGD